MGLFDRFRKRVHEVAEETDGDALSVEATSEEAQTLLEQPDEQSSDIIQDDDWDDVDAEPAHVTPAEDEDDDWDTWDDDEPVMPVALTKKERKLLERQEKERRKREEKVKKAMKKRGAVDVARPQGSKVDLSMMRTTTGRQLVQVAQAPKGSSKKAEIQMEGGQSIDVDLGGGVVSEGGRGGLPGAVHTHEHDHNGKVASFNETVHRGVKVPIPRLEQCMKGTLEGGLQHFGEFSAPAEACADQCVSKAVNDGAGRL